MNEVIVRDIVTLSKLVGQANGKAEVPDDIDEVASVGDPTRPPPARGSIPPQGTGIRAWVPVESVVVPPYGDAPGEPGLRLD